MATNWEELRRKAEEIVATQGRSVKTLDRQSLEETAHELAVYQAELEIQNEYLKQSQSELAAARDRYIDLFDFAPVGYFTLSSENTIEDVNLTGCAMLGMNRRQLRNDRFSRFVSPDDQDRFYFHRKEVLESGEKASCELRMIASDGSPFHAQIESIRIEAGRWRLAVLHVSQRVEAEQGLRESEERLRVALEGAGLGLWDRDLRTGRVVWNERLYELLGMDGSKMEITGDTFFEYVHPDDLARVRKHFDEVVASGDEFFDEFRVITAAGKTRWLASAGSVYRDETGSPVRMSGVNWDVTSRKLMEQEVQAGGRRYRELADSISDLFYAMDDELRCTFWNRASEEAMGIAAEEAIGKSIFDLLPDNEETQRAIEAYRDVLRTGEPRNFLIEYHEGGSRRVFDVSAYPSERGLVVLARDVTERKRAEEALRRAKDAWERTFDSVPDLIAILDDCHRIVQMNRAMAERLGCTATECVGLPCYRVVHGTEAPPSFCPHAASMADQREHGVEVHEQRLGGDFLVSTTPMMDDEGRMIGSVHVARDITKRKRIEKELLEEKEILKAVMENTRAHLAYLDPEFNFVAVNATYAEGCGYAKEELVGRNHFDLFPNEENEAIFRGVRDTGEVVYFEDKPFEFPAQPQRGVTYWNWTLAPIKDPRGVVIGLVLSLEETTARVRAEQGLIEYQRLLETRVTQRTEELAKAIEALKEEIAERKQAEKSVRESERRYRQLAERSLDGFARVDLRGRVVEWNRAFQEMLGYSDEEMPRLNYRDLTPERWHALEHEMVSRTLAEGYSPLWQEEYVRKDGTVFPVELRAYLTWTGTGEPDGMWAFVRDITERVQARKELERAQARLMEAQQIAHLGNWEWDIEADELWWSDEVYRIFGVDREEFDPTYDAFIEFVHPEDRERVNLVVEAAVHQGEPYSIDHRIVRPDGADRIVHERGVVSFDEEGKPLRMVGTVWDVTELKDTEMKLRALSRRLLQIQEEEQRALGRELHDQLGQSLTVLSLLLDRTLRADPKEVEGMLMEAVGMTNEIAAQIREISSQLRPRILDDLGLLPALIWQVDQVNNRTSVKVDFKHAGLNRRFPAEVSTAAFRIVQEALTNVVRHAGTDGAKLRVWADEENLVMHVEDQGIGFDPARMTDEVCGGISGMEERARLFGGEFSLESSPGYGTHVTAIIPLDGYSEEVRETDDDDIDSGG